MLIWSMNVRKKNKTNQEYMEWLWKGRGTILDGVSKEGLSDEVTLAGSFKSQTKPRHMPPCHLCWGNNFTSIYFVVLLFSSSRAIDVGSHCILSASLLRVVLDTSSV